MEGQAVFDKILSVINQSETVVFYCQFLPDWPVLYISDNFQNYGYDPQKLYSGELKYHQILHGDDVLLLDQTVETAASENRNHVSQVVRLNDASGQEFWVDLRITFERDDAGEVTHLLGKFFDITDKVQTEQQNQLLAKVVEQTADLVKVTDKEGYLVFVNQALLDKTGYSEQELLGRKPSIFKSDLSNRNKARHLWETITEGKVYKNLIRNRRKDGTTYFEEITISPVFGDSGEIEHFIATGKDLTEKVEMQASLNEMAMKDALTGTENRRSLAQLMTVEMERSNRYGQRFSLLMFDIDYFKNINDDYGHLVGDQVLIDLAHRVQKVMRASDHFGRWGGEEFLILGLEMDLNATLSLAEKVREAIADEPFKAVGKVTVSIGATVYYRSETADEILKRADEALYLAKNNGRNRVEVI